MPEPVLEAIESFDKALRDRDVIARNRLLSAYRLGILPVMQEAQALAERVATAPKIAIIRGDGTVGEGVPPSWTFQNERYQRLQTEIRGLVLGMAQELGVTTLEGQAAAWQTGVAEARAAGLALGEISPSSWASPPRAAFQAYVGGVTSGPLAPLLESFVVQNGAAAAGYARDVLGAGLLAGRGARQIARDLESGIETLTFSRAYRIARTETLRAYREGARASYKENPEVVQSWAWRAAVENTDRPPCAACFAKHGSLHPREEAMGTHPNCRCRMVPRRSPIFGVTPNDPKLLDAKEAFDRLSPAQQRRILGPGRLDLYERGRVRLQDFATSRSRGPWGRNDATVRPLYELRNLARQDRVLGEVAQRLFTQSANAEIRVSSALQHAADAAGGQMQGFAYRLKLPGRLAEKIQGDVLAGRGSIVGAGEGINDALRYTMTFSPEDYAAGVARTRAILAEQGVSVVKTKNFWNAPGGYREYRIIGQDPGGARFELQFHTPESFVVKMEKSHELYARQRRIGIDPTEAAALQKEIDDLWASVRIPPGSTELPDR